MEVDPRFPTRLDNVSDVPEPLRAALKEIVPADEPFRLLVHAPAFTTEDEELPATILAVRDTGWIVASETEEGGTTVEKSDFDNTLFLELTFILLEGELRLTFASVDSAYSVAINFDTVGGQLYRDAVDLILTGIDPSPGAPIDEEQRSLSMLETWPMNIRSEAQLFWPHGKRLLSALHWPTTPANAARDFASAGALLVTERELVVISAEPATPMGETPAEREGTERLQGVTTFIPRVRLVDFHVGHQEHCDVLTLQVRAPHGGERVEIVFPSNQERAVAKVIEQLFPR